MKSKKLIIASSSIYMLRKEKMAENAADTYKKLRRGNFTSRGIAIDVRTKSPECYYQ